MRQAFWHLILWRCYFALLQALAAPDDRPLFVHPSFCTALAPAELGKFGDARGQFGLGHVCVVQNFIFLNTTFEMKEGLHGPPGKTPRSSLFGATQSQPLPEDGRVAEYQDWHATYSLHLTVATADQQAACHDANVSVAPIVFVGNGGGHPYHGQVEMIMPAFAALLQEEVAWDPFQFGLLRNGLHPGAGKSYEFVSLLQLLSGNNPVSAQEIEPGRCFRKAILVPDDSLFQEDVMVKSLAGPLFYNVYRTWLQRLAPETYTLAEPAHLVTVVNRAGKRNLTDSAKIVELVKQKRRQCQEVLFEGKTWVDQAVIVRQSAVLITPHGAALFMMFPFMRKSAVLLEIRAFGFAPHSPGYSLPHDWASLFARTLLVWHNQDPGRSWDNSHVDPQDFVTIKHRDTEVGEENIGELLDIAFTLQSSPPPARGPNFGTQYLNQPCSRNHGDQCVEVAT